MAALLIFATMASATLNVTMYDQGTDVKNVTIFNNVTNNTIINGDLAIVLYDTDGITPIWNGSWSYPNPGSVVNGSWNARMDNIPLTYGKVYWKEYQINNETVTYFGNTSFPWNPSFGDINASYIINAPWMTNTYNATYDAKVTDNSSWNETWANSLFYPFLSNPLVYWNATFALFNKSYADTLYAPIGGGGNSSWNQSHANTLYASILEPLWSNNATAVFNETKWEGNSSTVARTGDCGINETVQNLTNTGPQCVPAGTGPQGIPGINGTNGIDGTNGTNGIDGTNGTNGVDGLNGTNGVDGINGTNGTNGADGLNGTNGIDGVNGTNGTNGIDGLNGTNGVDGTNGTNGVDGINGTNGVDGINGTNGTNGVDGANGTNGVDGLNGTNGTNGIDGTNGTNGIDGANGTNGVDGTNGTNGYSSNITAFDNGDGTYLWQFFFGNGTNYANFTTANLTGSQGIPGINGTNGVDGLNGTNGIDGTPGNLTYWRQLGWLYLFTASVKYPMSSCH